jgi:hypothetical protein
MREAPPDAMKGFIFGEELKAREFILNLEIRSSIINLAEDMQLPTGDFIDFVTDGATFAKDKGVW